MIILQKQFFRFLIHLCLYSSALNANSLQPLEWKEQYNINEFDGSIISAFVVVNAINTESAWLSISCNIEKKEFLLNISTGEYGRRVHESPEDKIQAPNFSYKIDDGSAIQIRAHRVLAGAISITDPQNQLLKKLAEGGRVLRTQEISNETVGKTLVFDISLAKTSIKNIIEHCK